MTSCRTPPLACSWHSRSDGQIDDYACSLSGFDRVEKSLYPGDVVDAMYVIADPQVGRDAGPVRPASSGPGRRRALAWSRTLPWVVGVRLTRAVGAGLGVLLVAGCGGVGPSVSAGRVSPDAPASTSSGVTVSPSPREPSATATTPKAAGTPRATATPRAASSAKPGRTARTGPGRTGAAARVPRRVILEQLRDRAERIALSLPSSSPETLPTDVDADSNRGLGYQMLLEFGFDAEQWSYLDALWQRESGWNHLAENPSSGAYGIPQSLPGSKMAVVGDDWRTNPETQISWGLAYIAARYGNPQGAWAHSERVGWY